jgi:hypothetical protein
MRCLTLSTIAAVLLTLCDAAQSSDIETFRNGFPADPNFFPVGVWLQEPRNAAEFKSIGVNTFVGLWQGPTEAQLSELAARGMFAVADQNETALRSQNARVIRGWMQPDEPDNAQTSALGGFGPCVPAATVRERTREMKRRDATRPVMINFGQGLANPYWKGRGSCTGDTEYYDIAMQGADIVSSDIYPVTSTIDPVRGKLEYVARATDELIRRARSGQTVWAVMETTFIQSQQRVTPEQLRAEIWMALIHGAKGIIYFVHEWTGGFREDGIFRHPEIVEEAKRNNQLIQTLAPVLNSGNVRNLVKVSSPSISIMVKKYEDALYIFAVAMDQNAVTARLQLPVQDGTAEVLGEARSIPFHGGILQDRFAGYGVRLYRVALPANR